MDISEGNLIQINGNTVTVNITLDDEGIASLRNDLGKVAGCQPPLIGTHKNGFSVFIPWILEDMVVE